ncbi:protein terminal ear1-like [Macadamia integrifolia]|uniref:protein terminal ear1-like n=1 Tax=Macadamia integrifolia TaxID=60698 RepID=UPI001C4F0920|nr:protein terminal ear1-like [Macadamia integrifolia]
MERLQEGIVTVHFYDLRHSATALAAIQNRHIQQQNRVGLHYAALGSLNFPPPLPPLADGLVAGCAMWAQFYVPRTSAGSNQGILMVRNLDPVVSSSGVLEIFESFGAVKELREAPLERHRWFVEFFDIRDAAAALSGLNGKRILRKHLKISFIAFPDGHGRM